MAADAVAVMDPDATASDEARDTAADMASIIVGVGSDVVLTNTADAESKDGGR
jgi:hypothetical protein